MRGVRQSVEDSDVRSERATLLLHGGERTCGLWIYARSDVARSGQAVRGNGKVLAARKVAKPSRGTATASSAFGEAGGAVEPQEAGDRHGGPDEEKAGERNAQDCLK